MRKRFGVLTAKQRDSLALAIIESYERNPGVLERVLPEVAKILASLRRVTKKIEYGVLFQLTPIERERRRKSLQTALDKLKEARELSREEAIQALEDAAALAGAFPLEPLEVRKNDIAHLIKTVTGFAVNTKGKRQKSILREGEPAKEVCLFRGVELSLTWDKKLISIEVEPKELAIRAKALSIIGIGSDTAMDAAAKHDEYFAEATSER